MNDLVFGLPVFVVGLLIASILIGEYNPVERRYLWGSFAAHQVSAISMILVTNYYYGGGDMVAYFQLGKVIADRLRSDFLGLAPSLFEVVLQYKEPLPFPGLLAGSNTGSIQALSGFLMFFFQDSLYAACSAIAVASFVAKVGVYGVLKRELPETPTGSLCIACLLVPSAVFWSAGLLKEPIAMVGLSAMVYGGYRAAMDRRVWSGGALFAVGAGIAGLFKGYLLPTFGLGAAMWFLVRAVQRRLGGLILQPRYVLLAAFITALAIVATSVALPQFSPETLEEEARVAQEIGARISGGSNFALAGEAGLGAQLPLAVATVLFRPVIFEATNLMVALNALEMTCLTVLMGMAFFRRRFTDLFRDVLQRPALAFCVGFVLTLSVGVGLTTTNLGTLSRYRMPLMNFYAVLMVALASRSAASNRFAQTSGVAQRQEGQVS